ncbi:MAG: thiamine phosphate synthase [Alphaproteobacteria bacterium]
MKPRQTVPRQWLVADERLGEELWDALERLPRGSGVLFLYRDREKAGRARLLRKLRVVARRRNLVIADEMTGEAARIHDLRELRRAAAVPLLFLSPMYPTRSHPDWAPLPKTRAAALARLARRPVIALGGMDERRFERVRGLGLSGWAGIDCWLTARRCARRLRL